MRGGRILLTALVLAGLTAGWFFWKSHVDDQEIGRAHFYARAMDEALARQANDRTATLFHQSLPPLPGYETAPREAPCPLTAVQLRASGPGRCYHFVAGVVPNRKRPGICRLVACIFISVLDAERRIPGTVAAMLSVEADPGAPCRAVKSEPDARWRRAAGDLSGDCTGGRWLKGLVFMVIWPDPPPAGASDKPDSAPPQFDDRTYRFLRLF